MEFHVIKAGGPGQPDKTDHIMTTNSIGKDDQTPMQFISAAMLEHYRRCEAELAAIKAKYQSSTGT